MKPTKKRLSDLEGHAVFVSLETIIAAEDSEDLTLDDIHSAACDMLAFLPSVSSVSSRLKSLGFSPSKRDSQRSDAKRLAEIVGLALQRLATGTPHEGAVMPIAEALVEGDIEAAYADRGRLVF